MSGKKRNFEETKSEDNEGSQESESESENENDEVIDDDNNEEFEDDSEEEHWYDENGEFLSDVANQNLYNHRSQNVNQYLHDKAVKQIKIMKNGYSFLLKGARAQKAGQLYKRIQHMKQHLPNDAIEIFEPFTRMFISKLFHEFSYFDAVENFKQNFALKLLQFGILPTDIFFDYLNYTFKSITIGDTLFKNFQQFCLNVTTIILNSFQNPCCRGYSLYCIYSLTDITKFSKNQVSDAKNKLLLDSNLKFEDKNFVFQHRVNEKISHSNQFNGWFQSFYQTIRISNSLLSPRNCINKSLETIDQYFDSLENGNFDLLSMRVFLGILNLMNYKFRNKTKHDLIPLLEWDLNEFSYYITNRFVATIVHLLLIQLFEKKTISKYSQYIEAFQLPLFGYLLKIFELDLRIFQRDNGVGALKILQVFVKKYTTFKGLNDEQIVETESKPKLQNENNFMKQEMKKRRKNQN